MPLAVTARCAECDFKVESGMNAWYETSQALMRHYSREHRIPYSRRCLVLLAFDVENSSWVNAALDLRIEQATVPEPDEGIQPVEEPKETYKDRIHRLSVKYGDGTQGA